MEPQTAMKDGQSSLTEPLIRVCRMITSVSEFVTLRMNDDERADRDDAPEPVWMEIVQTCPEMKKWVIHNKTVPASVLRQLAKDSDSDIRFLVASKRNCPADVLESLARDSECEVREQVARNKKTSVCVLRLLAEDSSEEVKALAKKRMMRMSAE